MTHRTMEETDVVVVGAGPVGALLTLGLAQRGHRVALIEAEAEVSPSPRALVYYWHVLDGLDRLGVLDDMEARGFRNTQFTERAVDSGLTAKVSLDPIRTITDRPYNVHLGQDEVARIALEHIARHPNATVSFNTRFESFEQGDDGVIARISGPDGTGEIRAGWLVGADGARSTVRRGLGLGFEGMTWPERFVAVNLRYPFDELAGFGNANMLYSPADGAVVVRITEDGLFRWTWAEDADLPEETLPERLRPRLERLGFGASEDAEFVEYAAYRMHQRSADRMREGRALILGDAAHVTNPTGGLGLTSGVYDAFALVEPLSAAVSGADPATLDEWADARLHAFNSLASPAASRMKRLVYDETDQAAINAHIVAAQDQSDHDAQRRKFSMIAALGTGVPRHHREL